MLPSEDVKSLELVDHIENLRVSPSRLARIEEESARDPVCIDLRRVILQGWPSDICKCEPVLHPFFQFRCELIVQGKVVFRRSRLFVPSSLRKEFMSLAHSSHNGLGGCLPQLHLVLGPGLLRISVSTLAEYCWWSSTILVTL